MVTEDGPHDRTCEEPPEGITVGERVTHTTMESTIRRVAAERGLIPFYGRVECRECKGRSGGLVVDIYHNGRTCRMRISDLEFIPAGAN